MPSDAGRCAGTVWPMANTTDRSTNADLNTLTARHRPRSPSRPRRSCWPPTAFRSRPRSSSRPRPMPWPPRRAHRVPGRRQAERRQDRPQDRTWARPTPPGRRRSGRSERRPNCSPPQPRGRRRCDRARGADGQRQPGTDRRADPRSTVRCDRDARCRRHLRRGARRCRVPPGAARRSRRGQHDRRPGHAEAARRVPRRATRSIARSSPTCSSASGDSPQERPDVASVDINPLIVQPDGRVIAVDGLVEIDTSSIDRRGRGAGPATADRRAVPGTLRTAWRARHRRVEPPRQVRVRLAPQPARQRLRRAASSAPT